VPYKVICISTTYGANGEEIARSVADELGFRLVNEEIVAQAAEQAGVERHVMADVERRSTLIDRVVHKLLGASSSSVALGFAAPPIVDSGAPADSLRSLIRTVIEEIASSGDAVILAHAASHALADRADTLRILTTAGPNTRRDRVSVADKVTEKTAEKRVADSDASRADYLKRFYEVSPELPTHYDIVLNTDRLSIEQSVDIIIRAASKDPESAPIAEAG